MTVTFESHSPTDLDETENDIVDGASDPPPPPAKPATAISPSATPPKPLISEGGGTLEAKTATSKVL